MEVLAWIRFLVGAALIIVGLLMFIVEVFGVYRFKYVLNRMHAAAMGDTLGIAYLSIVVDYWWIFPLI